MDETGGGEVEYSSDTSEDEVGSEIETVSEKGSSEVNANESEHIENQIVETPLTMDEMQSSVEQNHSQSIEQILENNSKYMSEKDINRVSSGVHSIRAVEYRPGESQLGGYGFLGGQSYIEVAGKNAQQIERTTKHETNHFASFNQEIVVPQPERNGHMTHRTIGTMNVSWFESNQTGQRMERVESGRGLNEGITTMLTNEQLTELSEAKGKAAERQGIYQEATELCIQLKGLVGEESIKETYYGGKPRALAEAVNKLGGEKGYEQLRASMDKTISLNPQERIEGMKEAQTMLERMERESRKGE